MVLSNLDLLLWIAAPSLSILCWLLCPKRHGAIREYLLFCCLRDIIQFMVWKDGSQAAYFHMYWLFQAISFLLQMVIISKLISESGLGLWPALIAMAATIFMPQSGHPGAVVYVVASLQRAIYAGRMAALAIVWLKQNDLSPLSREILTGFGLMAGVELAVAWVKAHFGIFGNANLNHLQIGFFLVMLCWWFAAFWREKYAE